MRTTSVLLVRWLLGLCILGAVSITQAADLDEAIYRRLNAALVEHHVITRYERLAAAADRLAAAARAFCAGPGASGLGDLRAAHNEGLDTWQGIQHVRFGPIELFMRASRFAFWPDPRNTTGWQLSEVITGGQADAITAEAFAKGSVAVQGFPALERLLFDEGAGDPLLAGDPEAAFRCELAMAIGDNMASMAADIVREWKGGDLAYAKLMANPGASNPYYRDHREATVDLFQSLQGGLEMLSDLKLAPPLGESAEGARPHLAESWRSGRSLENIRLNLEAAQALYGGEGGYGMDDVVREAAGDAELADLLDRAFAQTLATARSVEGPLRTAVADPARRPAVERLALEARALKQIVNERLASALGIPIGFNAMDGD
jgi:predicted lipoprotein